MADVVHDNFESKFYYEGKNFVRLDILLDLKGVKKVRSAVHYRISNHLKRK